jgi:hypothetical protein
VNVTDCFNVEANITKIEFLTYLLCDIASNRVAETETTVYVCGIATASRLAAQLVATRGPRQG